MRMRPQAGLHRCGRSITRPGPARRAAVLTTLGVVSAASTLTIVSGASTEAGEAAPSAVQRSQARDRLPDLPIDAASGAYSASALTSARGAVGATWATASSYDGIPSRAMTAYRRAVAIMDSVDQACGLTWPVLAAIGTIESNHGRHAGSLLDETGSATPPILGPRLNGRGRVGLIRDTDAGRYDHDTRFDRAVGPMQFIPTTWSAVGVDADGDGLRNPQDVDDAALAAGVFLCGGSEDLGSSRGLGRALFRYNRSWEYVRAVIAVVGRYAAGRYTDVPDDLVPGQFLVLASQPDAPGHGSPTHVPPSQISVVATNAGNGGTGHAPAGSDAPAADEDPDDSPGTNSGQPPGPASPDQPPAGGSPEPVENVTEALTEECLEGRPPPTDRQQGARTVVIGAGFIGSEVASSAKKRGVEVTIVEALPTPLVRATGTEMGPAIASLHERNGTTLRCGVGVRAIEGNGTVERVVLEDGTEIPADLVVVGIGVAPSVDWLEGSGLLLENGIRCDENLWTGVPGVYAAGDVANWPNPTLGLRQRMENWTAAAEQGAAAARNALDPDNAKPYGTVPYFWSDWYDVRIQHVGRPDADEVRLVEGDLEQSPGPENRWIALYRTGDLLAGALTVHGQTEIMKYRMQIMKGGSWDDALAHAAKRKELHAAKLARVSTP